MSGRSRVGAGASAQARVRRAGASGWEQRGPARDGVRFRGVFDVKGYGPAIVRASVPMQDIHQQLIQPGGLVKVWKRNLRELVSLDQVRELLQAPKLLWHSPASVNLVVDDGLDHILSSTLDGGSQITTWYVGLTDDTPTPAAGDNLTTHAGWTEFDEYTGTRKAWTGGAVSGQSIDNSGAPASFAINNDTNGGLGGCFLTEPTSGTTGILYSVVALTGGNRAVGNGDTVEVTYTFTSADDAV